MKLPFAAVAPPMVAIELVGGLAVDVTAARDMEYIGRGGVKETYCR